MNGREVRVLLLSLLMLIVAVGSIGGAGIPVAGANREAGGRRR